MTEDHPKCTHCSQPMLRLLGLVFYDVVQRGWQGNSRNQADCMQLSVHGAIYTGGPELPLSHGTRQTSVQSVEFVLVKVTGEHHSLYMEIPRKEKQTYLSVSCGCHEHGERVTFDNL